MAGPRSLAELRDPTRTQPVDRLVFALDVATLSEAQQLIQLLHADVGVFKIGLELFTAAGPAALEAVHAQGRRSFLDLKLHDIPATVERAVASAAALGASYLTLHAAAGPDALQAAARAAAGTQLQLLAVTVLTSSDEAVLAAIGMQGPLTAAVTRLARLAVDSGVSGLVCAPTDCLQLRQAVGNEVLLVTPGVRPAGAGHQDQKRVTSPSAALSAGADLLVVGRPIRDAQEPRAAARAIVHEIGQAL
ncbi:MAG: orotidine-5'-phosphate decarboxylase [Polyangiales bacterium]